ncbi:hypothetical protein GCM10022236_12750 [Microlunatus ginsengisoli]|uniref:Uncharacterized protein n=2 Tax=Microlunatus ginsengisoli TaxID=363863 RepID=A0ABP6ZKB8_9ACTN
MFAPSAIMTHMSASTPHRGYPASETCQIVEVGHTSSGLVVHESEGGSPLCNTPVRPWNGIEMVLVEQGRGIVTCGSCARIVHEAEHAPVTRSRICPTCTFETSLSGWCDNCDEQVF